MTMTEAKPVLGEIVEIAGLGMMVCVFGQYDYEADKCHCPVCQGIGYPWGGWFRCDVCPAIALVSSGECFMPVEDS
jgi:hypothetical protein